MTKNYLLLYSTYMTLTLYHHSVNCVGPEGLEVGNRAQDYHQQCPEMCCMHATPHA